MSERKTGRPSAKAMHIDEVRRLYLDEEWTLGEISSHLGPSVQTLSRWLQSEDVAIQARIRNPNAGRTAEEQAEINARISASLKKRRNPGGPKATYEERRCEWATCESTFRTSTNSPKRFCSMKCVGKSVALQRSETARRLWAQDPRSRCRCGGGIPYENRHIWRYCSDTCRTEYGAKRQPDPANYATFACLNCDETVTRRKTQGYHKYCSNACAQRHTKTKRHIVVDDAVVLDSGFEALFWGLCTTLGIPIECYDREHGVAWREGGWYAPDFWLPTLETAVELKGLEDAEDALKWSAHRQQRGPLKVFLHMDLVDLISSKSDLIATITKNP